jgi:hypothetical protein
LFRFPEPALTKQGGLEFQYELTKLGEKEACRGMRHFMNSGISPPNRQSAKPLDPVSTKSGEGHSTTMRFDPAIKAALDRAAKSDRRTASSLTMKILEDWLKEKGFLK